MYEIQKVLSKEDFRRASWVKPKDLKVSEMRGGYF